MEELQQLHLEHLAVPLPTALTAPGCAGIAEQRGAQLEPGDPAEPHCATCFPPSATTQPAAQQCPGLIALPAVLVCYCSSTADPNCHRDLGQAASRTSTCSASGPAGLGGLWGPPHRAWGCRILCGFWLVFLFPTSCRHLSGGAFGGCHCDPHVQQWPCTALYCTQPHVGTGHTDPRRETIPLLPTQHKITFWLCFREYYSCAAKLFFNGIFK